MKNKGILISIIFIAFVATFMACDRAGCDDDSQNIFNTEEGNEFMTKEQVFVRFTEFCKDTLINDTISLNTYTYHFNESKDLLELIIVQDFRNNTTPINIKESIDLVSVEQDYLQKLENERLFQTLLCLLSEELDSLACVERVDEVYPLPESVDQATLISFVIEERLGFKVPPVMGDTTFTVYDIEKQNKLCEDLDVRRIYGVGAGSDKRPIQLTKNETVFTFGSYQCILELSPNDSQSTFVFEWGDGHMDTIALSYKLEDYFVSENCGYMIFFDDVEVTHTTFTDWTVVQDSRFKIHINLKE